MHDEDHRRTPRDGARAGPRRLSRALLGGALLLAACADAAPDGSPHPRARGVVLFTIDTLRADRLGPYGGRAVPTPAIDRFARRAVVFDRAYSQADNTNPSVTSILTGLLPPRHGVLSQVGATNPDVLGLAVLLKTHGVATGTFVSNLCKLQDVPNSVFAEGWDTRFCGMAEGVPQREWDDAVVAEAVEWITARQRGPQPWFAWVHLMDPHGPYDPDDDRWDRASDPLRDPVEQLRYYSAWEEQRTSPPPADLARLHALYAAEVAGSDRRFGRLLDALERLDAGHEIALILSADHGEELYETWPRIGHGFSLTEGVLHVPLLVALPGGPAGRREEVVETLSITPTVLALFGLAAPYPLDGGSLFDPAAPRGPARSFTSLGAMSLRDATHRYWRRTAAEPPTRDDAPWRLEAPWFLQPECLAGYDGDAPTVPRWLTPDRPEARAACERLRVACNDTLFVTLRGAPEPTEIRDEAYLELLRQLGYL